MNKIVFFIAFCFSYILRSQDFTGFNQSNYAGVSGVYMQPASIVDSRMKFDMNLIGISAGAYNNYIGINRSALKKQGSWTNPSFPGFNDPDFQTKYSVYRNNGNDKKAMINARIAMPSFMININHKNAIAFQWNIRNYVNVDGVSQQLVDLVSNQLDYPSLWVSKLENKNLSVQQMSWEEYGLTYARIIKEDHQHFIKAGLTVKLLRGLESAYFFAKDLKYSLSTDTTVALLQSHFSYGHSDNININNVSLKGNASSYSYDFKKGYFSIAFDIGVVYEWRPDFEKYKYEMDGEKNLWSKDENKYKLKVGVSVTDIGSIKFKKGGISNDFNANIGYWSLKPISPSTFENLNDTFSSRFDKNVTGDTYKMNLPLAFSTQIDYHIWKDIYINLTPYIAAQFKKNDTKVHEMSSVSLIPRWDHKWVGVFIPIQYNFLDGFRAGTAIRLGPLVLGSSNLGPLLGQKTLYGADVYALLKIPIPYNKPKDRDKDGISNKKDECRDFPGIWEFMGCPDRDGDHIKDSEDKCPDVAGLKELLGCPDIDRDGITDLEDNCPTDSGLVEFKGCPDKDGDKVIDKEDLCPTDAGLVEFMGCPDRDNDKIPDKEDLCPDLAGPKDYKGCPDKDGDTVLDKDDNCPDVAGIIENRGCPWPDTDNDGVNDREDECPTTQGLKELKGCPPAPVLKVEEQKILEKAFSSLEFATGKDIIKNISYSSLNELAALMKLHAEDWVLKLSGHTDNQGNETKNMLLSEKRSKSVKKYLVSKGVKSNKIIAEWFGQTIPIDSNETESGRQRNRRVEMKVLFKE